MPTWVIVLIVFAVISFIGGILSELINKLGIFLMCLTFIIATLINKDSIISPFNESGNLYGLLYVLLFAAVGALFAVPYFIPSIDIFNFSIGSLVVSATDYRAGIGFCGFGAIAGAIISGPCLGKFYQCGQTIIFILPAIIIGGICLIYSIILIIGIIKGW